MLLTQRGPGARHEHFKWEVPGGEVEPDETYEQGAVREFREEMGVTVTLSGVIAEHEAFVDSKGTPWAAKIFKGSISEVPAIQEPTKCVGFGWFTRTEIVELARAGLLADYAAADFHKMGWL